MRSQLEIINEAFAILGEDVVDQITQDPKPPNVVKALARWDAAIDRAQASAPWLCCLERRTITRNATKAEDPVNGVDGDWKYPYVYTLPVETLRIWEVCGDPSAFAWERSRVIQGKFVGRPVIRATSAGPLLVALTLRTIPELQSPLLDRALALDLAADLAGPIQSDAAKAAALRKEAQLEFTAARGAEATEFGGGATTLLADPLHHARRRAL